MKTKTNQKNHNGAFSGCGGVMVFRLGCDKTMDNPNSVSNGIKNTVERYIEN